MEKKVVLEETLGDLKNVRLYYEGSGRPEDEHQIIGLRYITETGEHRYIGDYQKMIQQSIKRIQK